MSPSVAPPFPFYIINKDIIKGSFPFRKTFLTPKPDFAPSIPTASSVPPTRRAGTEPRKRNKPEAKDAPPAEARFHNPDFTTSIPTAPRVPPTRRAETESRKRNKPEAKESFPVRRTRQFKDYSIFAPEDFKTRFQTSPSGSSESPLLSLLRHRYCQVNPPTERLNNTHGNICNQVTSVDEFRCFSAFCA